MNLEALRQATDDAERTLDAEVRSLIRANERVQSARAVWQGLAVRLAIAERNKADRAERFSADQESGKGPL
jgi:hypothetical protein